MDESTSDMLQRRRRRRRRPTYVALALVLSVVATLSRAQSHVVDYEAGQLERRQMTEEPNPLGQKRAIFFSESKLRAVVETTNLELRQLKRDFLKQITDVYLRLKLDPDVGYERARDHQTQAPSANLLLAEEFATILIKRHIIQRRLLTGLKLAFIKMLPMQTLVQLYRRYKSFEWLKDQEQIELRPKFAQAKENQFVILYTLIELRARVRAADDVLALTKNNIRRVLQVIQWFLVDSEHGRDVTGDELAALARNSKWVLQYYESEVFEWRDKLHSNYATFLHNARPLAKMIGGQQRLAQFIDRLIDVEALDVDLNESARSAEFPPTISEQMLVNVQRRWIPWYVLKSLEEDRKVLIENRKRVMHLIRVEEEPSGGDSQEDTNASLRQRTSQLLDYVCHNQVTSYYANSFGRF